MAISIPDYLDEVKNIVSDVTGVVDATYKIAGIDFLDVIVDDRMVYRTPARNWEATVKYVP